LDAVHEAAGPRSLVGCISQGIVAGPTEIEDGPAVAVWLARFPGDIHTFHADGELVGWPEGDHRAYLTFADPHTFPADALLRALNERSPGAVVVGGLAGGAAGPGQTRLFIDKDVVFSGAVGVALSGVEVVALVSQGCRPVGRSLTVTRAESNVIFELGGKPPVERIRELYAALSTDERALVAEGLLIGRVIDEYKTEFERGDFLVRAVMGADPESGAIAIGDAARIGEIVQFHVRDAASADEDLRETLKLASEKVGGRAVAGGLLFECNGRGRNMFTAPSHDAALITKEFGGVPLAGFFCAGELGPVGGQNFLHGFTASMALFCEDAASD
ncbi:MAG: FIST signal transduction protein, partial [Actinomycetota bacterium]